MNTTTPVTLRPSQFDLSQLTEVVGVLYDKMLADYRINRFFNTRPVAEQVAALVDYIKAAQGIDNCNQAELHDLLDAYFMTAFARSNAKPSLVNGNDFAFLLDIVGGREIRTINLLCDSHGWLMKLGPDDDHYDVMMAHLIDALQELQITGDVAARFIKIAESGREGVLGRAPEILKAA